MRTSNKSYSTEVVRIHGTIRRETPNAILIIPTEEKVDCDDEESYKGLWFPFSQVKKIFYKNPDEEHSEFDYLDVTAWIAKQKGVHAK